MDRASFSIIVQLLCYLISIKDKKAISLLFVSMTSINYLSEASVCNVNGIVQYGKFRRFLEEKLYLSSLKTTSYLKIKSVFLSLNLLPTSINGANICYLSSCTYLQYWDVPIRTCYSVVVVANYLSRTQYDFFVSGLIPYRSNRISQLSNPI